MLVRQHQHALCASPASRERDAEEDNAVIGRYQGFTFLGLLNTWIPLPVRWFWGVTSRWWGQASSMLGVGPHPSL